MNVEQSEIEELRQAFLQHAGTEGNSKFHPKDLTRVKSDDSWLSRFLLHHEKDQMQALNMMKLALEWRNTFDVNEITDKNIKLEYMIEGCVFPRGHDVDGNALLIFKCKYHKKTSKDSTLEIKRCIIYWLERLERQENGKPISIFLDMQGCTMGNVDVDLMKYIIDLFKLYYPYFINYIIVFEMAWMLGAVFKILKALLPPKAVEKLKVLKKTEVFTFVPEEEALQCWGGKDDYVFSFMPEASEENSASAPPDLMAPPAINVAGNKKVHFATEHADQMNDSAGSWDRESAEGSALTITPSSVLSFIKDGDEYVTTLEIKNSDPKQNISYKLKTNAPQKFRVRPSAGFLAPGDAATISIFVLPAYQISGLSRDKFLVMSVPIAANQMSGSEVAELWKNAPENVTQHRLRCSSINNTSKASKNGSAIQASADAADNQQLAKIATTMSLMLNQQDRINRSIGYAGILQIINLILLLIIGIIAIIILRNLNAEYEVPIVDERASQYYNNGDL